MALEKKPNFIIGGAPRSATTWLYQALNCHPDIFMASPVTPEPKFFLVDSEYEKGVSHYMRYFQDRSTETACGEKSTNYLESPKVAQRVHQDFPDMKFIFILREPVSRAYCNYLWSKSNGVESESFERALELEKEREANIEEKFRYARPHALFSRGCYAHLLRPYFELFSSANILCLRMEDMFSKGDTCLRAIYNFLDVIPMSEVPNFGIVNAVSTPSEPMQRVTRKQLEEAYKPHNEALKALLGEAFDAWSYN